MNDSLSPTDPGLSCSVLASAGTGKTWQLVARLTRLLLNGAPLDSILAITFTRKAAGEMQERLGARLRELLEADEEKLDCLLKELGETPNAAMRDKARSLFETVLRSEQSLRATTFHSFCQDLLQRFPLEAGLPPGFELIEQTGVLITEAWDALFADATREPEQPLAKALQQLFNALNGPYNTRTALFNFVEHRSDWWAFTQGSNAELDDATEHLRRILAIDHDIASGINLWSAQSRAELREFLELLQKHGTATNKTHAQWLADALADTESSEDGIKAITPVCLTGTLEPRKRKSSKAQVKAMGQSGEDRFLQLHTLFCERLSEQREHRNRELTLATNSDWYLAGARMLAHYQRIKRERRLLDFSDLEWNTYQLLNHPDQAHWIQYKLDQRIDHLLIDEFQDTNPTQWRLIKPLLDEMAAGSDRWRSLFVVGDAKQSIYRFRRGNPRLLGFAADWMQQHLGAGSVHLDQSWRSSPLIMDTVNELFQHDCMQGLLTDFQHHSTHLTNQWGRLEIWPLIEPDDQEESCVDFTRLRDPLLEPRAQRRDSRYYREGLTIAQRIRELLDENIVNCNDILILLRSRTHLSDYEAALRDTHIPYLSQDRGTLLESLEIRDMESLLKVLMAPQDNLSLAQVLRSPLFSVDDDALLHLASGQTGSWFERLTTVTATDNTQSLMRAAQLLTSWQQLAGRIPIHDLLETIFHQANVVERYQAAFPAIQVPRVNANLVRFIELALEVDAGRYPTLPRFLDKLQQLRSLDREGPSQATPQSDTGQRVRLLTIHASKGLEAPVVFLADSASTGGGSKACQTLVRWPAEKDRPSDFMLLNRSLDRDSISTARYDSEKMEAQREAANLLYVALTRARNMLVISGCRPTKRPTGQSWYEQLVTALGSEDNTDSSLTRTHGTPHPLPQDTSSPVRSMDVDPRLGQTIKVPPAWHEIAPSRSAVSGDIETGDADGIQRGLVIHRLLQLAVGLPIPQIDAMMLLRQVAGEYSLRQDDPRLNEWWQEVETIIENRSLAWLTQPGVDHHAFSEIPIEYRRQNQTVYGVIDRLVVGPEQVTLVDYKTHRLDDADIEQLGTHYRPQLELYREGVQRLWPNHSVRACLLLTHGCRLVDMT